MVAIHGVTSLESADSLAITMLKIICFIYLLVISYVLSERLPDTSDKCLSCEDKVSQLQSVWTNATR
jgi:hypothetical protein